MVSFRVPPCPSESHLVSIFASLSTYGGHENVSRILAARVRGVTECESPTVCSAHYQQSQLAEVERHRREVRQIGLASRRVTNLIGTAETLVWLESLPILMGAAAAYAMSQDRR